MSKKILIVDDSELAHKIYKIMLMKDKEYVFLDAMNGQEALEVISRENGVDLILLDINMPLMNGYQFMERLNTDGYFKGIPVMVISTEGDDNEINKAFSLGARDYIVKPRTDMLSERVGMLLN